MTNNTLNYDPNEIAKFEQLAAHWWDKEGHFKPLHEINPLRLQFILKHTGSIFQQAICDVGCGGGILSEALAQQGAVVTGIDMGKEPLQVAQLHGLEVGIHVDYQQTTVEQLVLSNAEQFSVVTCLEMLEHVPDPASIIRSCAQLVPSGGKVFFSTLNRTVKSYLLAIIGAEYLLQLLPKGTHQHDKFIRPSELITWANDAGLLIKDIVGINYNPILKTYSLSQDVDVNYLMYFEKE